MPSYNSPASKLKLSPNTETVTDVVPVLKRVIPKHGSVALIVVGAVTNINFGEHFP